MNRKQKKTLYRIVAALVLFFAGFLVPGYIKIACYLAAWLLTGYETIWKAIVNIGHGQVFDENFLMAIATLGAFALQDWDEGAAVMIFFQIGELFESCAVDRSRKSIAKLMALRPDYAYVYREQDVEEIDPEEVQVGDLLRVLPGERIPVDGVIVEGQAAVDTAAITGESIPQDVSEGNQVLSGCVNLSGVLKVRAESQFRHSTVARILELVESSAEKKSQSERMITKFARYYTPIIVISAVLLAVLPPLVLSQSFIIWLKRALSFLVISCPCALVISVPLSFFGGMGAASKAGVVVKGGVVLERLAQLETVVMDKTGTITTGRFRVIDIEPVGMSGEELLHYAASAEQFSAHPVAQAIVGAVKTPASPACNIEDLPGYGVCAQIDGAQILIGNDKLMEKYQIAIRHPSKPGTVCYLAKDGQFAGWILLGDEIKAGIAQFITQLKKLGVRQVVMLTGDHRGAAEQVAKQAGIDVFHAQLLPQDKVMRMEEILAQKTAGKFAAFVGDGVNDAPVLSMADIGIAMGSVGSDAAVEASDLVILNDDPRELVDVIRISRKTCTIAKQNIVFAIGIKVLILLLSAVGVTSMWMAIFADVGVAVLAILNAMRAMH